jgi:hypothetical protein
MSVKQKETSLWITTDEKEMLEMYRNQVFGDEAVALRHALKHAIQNAREVQGEDDE